MTRKQLEHIIRASAATADVNEIVVIGSQSILGSFPDAPPELTQSIEADVFPKSSPERSIVIDGAIGELSLFHETFGYYAHGVDDTTATLPDGWTGRLVPIHTSTEATGWCLDPHDLAVSKLAAGREKDIEFVSGMLRAGLISVDVVRKRLAETPRLPAERAAIAMAWIASFGPARE